MYFSTYEAAKVALGVKRSQHAPLATAAAGAMATIVNDAFMTPGDVIKQRLQIANSPYKGVLDCIRGTYKHEGLRAFYRSYKTTVRSSGLHFGMLRKLRSYLDRVYIFLPVATDLFVKQIPLQPNSACCFAVILGVQVIMNIPFTAVHFSAYETAKRLIDSQGDDEALATQLIAGGAAGGLSAACTNPLDVVKTRLQTDGVLQHRRHIHSSDVVRKLQMCSTVLVPEHDTLCMATQICCRICAVH